MTLYLEYWAMGQIVQQFITLRISELGISTKMLQVYVDDQNIVTIALPLGAKIVNGELVIDEAQIEIDRDIPADLRTAKIFQQVSNSIYDFMQVTIDCPSQHQSGFMPVLDIQVKMNNNKIIHKFYKKPFSSNKVIMAKSALPTNVKKASLTEGVIRRLRYTDRSLPWSEVAEILSIYSNELRLSGYDQNFRAEIIQAGLKGFRRQCRESDSGGCPLFRPRHYDRQKRRKNKLMAKEIWYRPKFNIVQHFPSSVGGRLAAGIQQIVREEGQKIGLNIRVTEQSGTSVAALLTTPDLSGCLYPRCTITEQGASHSRRGANYTGTCLLCGSLYRGETGFGAHTRVCQHQEDIRRNADSNSIALHITDQHPEYIGDPNCISFSVNKTGNKPMPRQILEAVQISNTNPLQLMNGRSEYIRPVIQRMAHVDLLDDERVRRPGTN